MRLSELDFLRFFAAVCVMLYHYTFWGQVNGQTDFHLEAISPISRYMYLGVHLFFIISGFVIAISAAGSTPIKFLASRIARLYPAFWIGCTLTFVVMLFVHDPRVPVVTWLEYLQNMTLFGSYMDATPVDTVYWTLSVEMRFYFWVFILVLLGQTNRLELYALLWLIASAMVIYVAPSETLSSLIVAPSAPYFVAGLTAYCIYNKGHSVGRWLTYAACLIFALSLEYDHVVSMSAQVRWDWLVVFAIVTAIFVVFALLASRNLGFFGQMNWTLLGGLTYPLYLIHQHIGFIIFNRFPEVDKTWLLIGVCALMLLLAYIISKQFEARIAPRLKRLILRIAGDASLKPRPAAE